MARDGDEFEFAVIPALDGLYSLARRLTRSGDVAEELAQETLTRAWAAWIDGRRPDRVGPWLATICLNIVRDRSRRPDRETSWPEGLDVRSPVDVEAEVVGKGQLDLIDRALRHLPEEQRLAITLMDVCGLTAAETAVITGAPRGTVLSRVHRGRRSLARLLDEGAPGSTGGDDVDRTDRAREGRTTDDR